MRSDYLIRFLETRLDIDIFRIIELYQIHLNLFSFWTSSIKPNFIDLWSEWTELTESERRKRNIPQKIQIKDKNPDKR